MNLRKVTILSVALASMCAALVNAQTSYATRVQTIKAGVLLVSSNVSGTDLANDAPFAWDNLDQNLLIKPASWKIENPVATPLVTSGINARWSNLTGGGAVASVGTRLTKTMAPYWEVDLTTASATLLEQYDVLLLPVYRTLKLTPRERELLRRFVDQGGILWVDTADTATVDAINSLPVPFQLGSSTGTRYADFFSGVLNYPNPLNLTDIRLSEVNGTGVLSSVTPSGSISGLLSSAVTDSKRLSSVASDGAGSTIAVGQVGNGHVIVTTRAVARVLNQGFTSSGVVTNAGFYGQDAYLGPTSIAAAKLVVNLVSLNSSYAEVAQGTRSQGSLTSSLGAPMLPSFNTPGAGGTLRPAAFFKGLMVVTDNSRVYVYSAKPGTDLDGSGKLDYGIQGDYSLGQSYDLIWTSAAMTGPLSPPTCVEVGTPGAGIPKEQVLVTDGNGTLHAFDAYQLSGGVIATNVTAATEAYTITPASGGSGRNILDVPLAPVYHDGVVFVADSQTSAATFGRIWLVDPARGAIIKNSSSSEMDLGGSASQVMNEFSGLPTIGYIAIQDNSEGLDRVAYVPSFASTGTGPKTTASINSIWIGVKGEVHRVGAGAFDAKEVAGVFEIHTRAESQGVPIYVPENEPTPDPLGLRVSLVRADGTVYTQSEMEATFTGGWTTAGGIVRCNLAGSLPADVAQVRLDYTVDWGQSITYASSIIRGQLYMPDDASHKRRLMGSPALGANGNLFAVLSTGTPPKLDISNPSLYLPDQQKGGSVFAFREKGRGLFTCLYRYDAHDAYTYQTTQGSTKNYPVAFSDNDGQLPPPDIQGEIGNLTFTSPAVLRNGQVYVTAAGWRNMGSGDPTLWTPVSVLLALDASPSPRVIYMPNATGQFQIVQPDALASVNKSTLDHYSILQPSNYQLTVDASSPYSVLRIDNLMDVQNGQISNCLNTGGPVLIRQTGIDDVIVEPNSIAGATWNPLQYYALFPGYLFQGQPLLAGDTLYLSGASALSSILRGVTPYSYQGCVVAFNGAIGLGNSSEVVADSNRNWLNQAHVLPAAGASVSPSENLLWPRGITDVTSLWARVDQSAIVGSTGVTALSGGIGVLGVGSGNSLQAFNGSSIEVADSGRLVRLNPSGETEFTTEVTTGSATLRDTGFGTLVRNLETPVRSRPVGLSDTLVVDAGASRLIRMDAAGREVRSIDGFKPDSGGFRPDGFHSSESLKFAHPRDAVVYTEYKVAASNQLATPQALEYWVHYLVADTGNHRLIDIVDRYQANAANGSVGDPVMDATGAPQLGVLVWHSPALYTNKRWAFNSVARIQVGTTTANTRAVIAAGIDGTDTTTADLGLGGSGAGQEASTGNGSVIVFDSASTIVINRIEIPAMPSNIFWNGVAFTSPAYGARSKAITGLTSVTLSRSGGEYPYLMITDNSGVYECSISGGTATARWILPTTCYTNMLGVNALYTTGSTPGLPVSPGIPNGTNPKGFRPNYAVRLDSSHVLIADGYMGSKADGTPTKGEVVIVSGLIDTTNNSEVAGFGFGKLNLGFGTHSLRYQMPPVSGSRELFAPVFADRR